MKVTLGLSKNEKTFELNKGHISIFLSTVNFELEAE